jgi:cell wall-associated NlpC family hydrolase
MSPFEWEQHVQKMLSDSRGWPYVRAMGTPQTPWERGRRGVDCSGYAQMALVRLGILSPQTPDQASSGLQVMSRPVSPGGQLPGDLAFYGRRGKGVVHVEVVTSMPGVDGHSLVQGASGSGVKQPRHALSWERDAEQPRFWGYGRIGAGPRIV